MDVVAVYVAGASASLFKALCLFMMALCKLKLRKYLCIPRTALSHTPKIVSTVRLQFSLQKADIIRILSDTVAGFLMKHYKVNKI